MRITAPSWASRVRLDEIDLADPGLYVNGDAHLVWQTLRAECPVFRQEQVNGPGFWAVTRRADVRRVLGDYESFTSEQGTALSMLGAPDPSAGQMMQATDPPRHKLLREQIVSPFSSHAVLGLTEQVRGLVREAMGPVFDGEVWDVAGAFTRLPMMVAAILMGLPKADIDPLLRLSFASLAPLDPRYGSGSDKVTLRLAHYELMQYFSAWIAERRRNPSTDLVSHLLSVEVNGSRLTDRELLLNCVSLILGAVVTTSQAISATLLALAEQHGGVGHWSLTTPVRGAVEEALRWSSPVTHFMRHARSDVKIHGQLIRMGDAVTAWIASANRDETVFDFPYKLDLDRLPNRHVAFGSGPHRCIGSNLARLILKQSFEELIASIESFEPAAPPIHLVSTEIAGLVSLPLRLVPRRGAAGG
jgi:cytochrome P450